MLQSTEIAELYSALSAAQAELANPTKDKTAKVSTRTGGTYSYSYADIADVLEGVRPILSKHGLSILQFTVINDGDLTLRTRLAHKSGQFIEADYPVCRIGGDHQQMGAALTYARRYALCPMLGIAADGDTDANGAAEAPRRDQQQKAQGNSRPQERAAAPSTTTTTEATPSADDALAYMTEWRTYLDNEDNEQAIRATWTHEKPQRVAAGLTEKQVAEMMQAMKKRFDEIRDGTNLLMAGE
jgi:hypothetical protein